jgi:capsular exopolysaccharide synthesis family protein
MSRVEQALRRKQVAAEDDYLIIDDEPEIQPAPSPRPVLFEAPDTILVRDAATEPIPGEVAPIEPIAPVVPEAAPVAAPAVVMSDKLVTTQGFDAVATEEYRKLAAALHQMQQDHGTKAVMVTSTLAAEGKTLTAANLAVTLSESFHRRVLLIDADLRRPSAHEMFGCPNTAGLSNELDADQSQLQPLIDISERLTLLPAGPRNSDPMSALTSERMQHLIDEAVTRFDWVVLDAPPVLAMPDASLLARMLDIVVFVVRAGKTSSRSIQRAMGLIDKTKFAGVVLNRVAEGRAVYGYGALR